MIYERACRIRPFPGSRDHAILFWWSHAIRKSFSLRKKSWNNWKIKLQRQESGLNERHWTLIILITALPLYIIHRLHSTLITTTHVTLIGIHGKFESFVQDFPYEKKGYPYLYSIKSLQKLNFIYFTNSYTYRPQASILLNVVKHDQVDMSFPNMVCLDWDKIHHARSKLPALDNQTVQCFLSLKSTLKFRSKFFSPDLRHFDMPYW